MLALYLLNAIEGCAGRWVTCASACGCVCGDGGRAQGGGGKYATKFLQNYKKQSIILCCRIYIGECLKIEIRKSRLPHPPLYPSLFPIPPLSKHILWMAPYVTLPSWHYPAPTCTLFLCLSAIDTFVHSAIKTFVHMFILLFISF